MSAKLALALCAFAFLAGCKPEQVAPTPQMLFEAAAKRDAAGMLKDPSSAIFTNVRTTFDGKHFATCGNITGRNGFGGVGAASRFVVSQRAGYVWMIENGKVHSAWSEYCS